MLLGAILLFIVGLLSYPAVKVAKAKRRRNKLKRDYEARYNGFHLGEMTGHDVPAKFTQRKEPVKYIGQHYREARERKEGTKNGKEKD
jgi:hypothetical protein